MSDSYFQTGKHKAPVQGTFVADCGAERLSWTFEIWTNDEKHSLLLNFIDLDDSKYPNQLLKSSYDSADETMDYGEHALTLAGRKRELGWFSLVFKRWDRTKEQMLLQLEGATDDGEAFRFRGCLAWQGLHVIDKDQKTALATLKSWWERPADDITCTWAEAAGERWSCHAKVRGGQYQPRQRHRIGPSSDAPVYDGKTLLDWLESVRTGTAASPDGCVAVRKIAAKTKGVVPQVMEYVKHAESRCVAVYALGKIGRAAQQALPVLVPLMKTPEDTDRLFVAEALASIGGGGELLDVFRNALHDPYFAVGRCAAEGLGRLGPLAKTAIPDLIEALENEQLLGSAAEALGKFGVDAEGAVPKLVEIVTKPDWGPDYRCSAIEALVRIGTADAVKAVRSVADDPNRRVRKAAQKMLPALR